MKTKRIDFAQGSLAKDVTLNDDNTILGMDRSIYTNLADRTANRTLTLPTEINSPFDRWLTQMQIASDPAAIVPPDIAIIDEYLGTLGVTDEYPYFEDRFSIEPWIDVGSQELFRVVLYRENTSQDIGIGIIDRSTSLIVVHDTKL